MIKTLLPAIVTIALAGCSNQESKPTSNPVEGTWKELSAPTGTMVRFDGGTVYRLTPIFSYRVEGGEMITLGGTSRDKIVIEGDRMTLTNEKGKRHEFVRVK